jgi:hypothetical protein
MPGSTCSIQLVPALDIGDAAGQLRLPLAKPLRAAMLKTRPSSDPGLAWRGPPASFLFRLKMLPGEGVALMAWCLPGWHLIWRRDSLA